MRTIQRLALAVFCLLIVSMPAAAQVVDRYTIPFKITLSGSSRTITIVPLAGKRIELEQVTIQPVSSGGVTLQIERDCSAVTTTTAMSKPAINGASAPSAGAKFSVYDASAATGCTALSPDWIVPDYALLPVPAGKTFNDGGTNRNINIRIAPAFGAALSGTLRGQVVLTEAR